MEELSSIASLLQQRGKATNMAMAMTKQYCNKLEGAGPDMSATDILKLSDHVAASEMPEECKDQILGCLDTIALQDNSGQSATKLLLQPQACPHLNNYLTAAEWKSLQTQGLWGWCECACPQASTAWNQKLEGELEKACSWNLGFDASSRRQEPNAQVQDNLSPWPSLWAMFPSKHSTAQCQGQVSLGLP